MPRRSKRINPNMEAGESGTKGEKGLEQSDASERVTQNDEIDNQKSSGEGNATQADAIPSKTASDESRVKDSSNPSKKVTTDDSLYTKEHGIFEENIHNSSLLEMLIEAMKNIVQKQEEIITILRKDASRVNVERNVATPAENSGQEQENYRKEIKEENSKNNDGNKFYSSLQAFKIYQRGLEDVRCKKVGDPLFFVVKRTWNRLNNDFPISEATKHRLLPLAFDGDARRVYEEIAGTCIGFPVDVLWEKLELRLCNEVHRAALQDRFFELRWNEKRESFYAFAQKLRSAALALPNGMTEEIMLNRLKAGIPTRLRDQAQLITGSFDEVVSRLSRVSGAQLSRESVREISEEKTNNTSIMDLEKKERYANYLCHSCGERGHISRYCHKNKKLMGKVGGSRSEEKDTAPKR